MPLIVISLLICRIVSWVDVEFVELRGLRFFFPELIMILVMG